MADPTAPTVNVLTTINQYLSSAWVDQVLRSNFFFGEVLANTEQWKGSQMLFQIKYQKGTATVAFNGFDVLPTNQQPVATNMTFYPTFKKIVDVVKSFLIYGEVPNYAIA